jgi:SAM-dependent methyltransferase
MSEHPYQHGFEDGSAYAHAWELLDAADLGTGLVVDLGCGFGALAERIVGRGLGYLGLDYDPAGVGDLRARGFEAATIDLEDVPGAMAAIDRAVAGRPVVAYLLLDVLEHLTDPAAVATAVRDRDDGAHLVVSIPNASHLDIVAKLLVGRFEMTETGLLDRTHVRFFTDATVTGVLGAAGWAEVARRDVVSDQSDQTFPRDLPPLVPHTPVRDFLAGLHARADGHGATYQFVRRYEPGERVRATSGGAQDGATGGHDADLCLVVVGPDEAASTLLAAVAAQPWADRAEIVLSGSGGATSVPDALAGRVTTAATTVGALRSRPARRLAVVPADVELPPDLLDRIVEAEEVAPGRVVWFEPDTPEGAPPPDPFDLVTTGGLAPLRLSGLVLPTGALELVFRDLDLAVDEDLVAAVAEIRYLVGVHRRPEVLFGGPGGSRMLDEEAVLAAITSHLKDAPVLLPPGALVVLAAGFEALRDARAEAADVTWIRKNYQSDMATKDAQIAELDDTVAGLAEQLAQLDERAQVLTAERQRARSALLALRSHPEVRLGARARTWLRRLASMRSGNG